MNQFIAAAATDTNFMDKVFKWLNSDLDMPTALINALIGICVVFLTLAVIILMLSLLSAIFKFNLIEKATEGIKNFFRKLFGRKDKSKELPAPPPAVEAKPDSQYVDDETVAAISAALALVMTDATGKPVPFVIRKIRHL